jgi:cytochrome b subunit of formate dehydrogenase
MHTYIYIYMFLSWCVGLSIFHMSLSLNLGFAQDILPGYLLNTIRLLIIYQSYPASIGVIFAYSHACDSAS